MTIQFFLRSCDSLGDVVKSEKAQLNFSFFSLTLSVFNSSGKNTHSIPKSQVYLLRLPPHIPNPLGESSNILPLQQSIDSIPLPCQLFQACNSMHEAVACPIPQNPSQHNSSCLLESKYTYAIRQKHLWTWYFSTLVKEWQRKDTLAYKAKQHSPTDPRYANPFSKP